MLWFTIFISISLPTTLNLKSFSLYLFSTYSFKYSFLYTLQYGHVKLLRESWRILIPANIEQATKGIVPEPQNGSHNLNYFFSFAYFINPVRYKADAVKVSLIGPHPTFFFHPCLYNYLVFILRSNLAWFLLI